MDAARRAATRVRRYAVENELRSFITLTFREPVCDAPGARERVRLFVLAVRRSVVGGRPMPWVSVMETNRRRPGFHAHLLLPAVDADVVVDRWRHGRAHALDLPTIASVRRAASYVAKTFSDPRDDGQHRYDLARGFQPERVVIDAEDRAACLREVVAFVGREPDLMIEHRPDASTPVASVFLRWDSEGDDCDT